VGHFPTRTNFNTKYEQNTTNSILGMSPPKQFSVQDAKPECFNCHMLRKELATFKRILEIEEQSSKNLERDLASLGTKYAQQLEFKKEVNKALGLMESRLKENKRAG